MGRNLIKTSLLILFVILTFSGCGARVQNQEMDSSTNSSGAPLELASTSTTTLRQLATSRGFYIGAMVSSAELSTVRTILNQEFNMMNDSGLKFVTLEPHAPHFTNGNLVAAADPTQDFSLATTVEDTAKSYGMKIHAHTLLYNLAEPTWLTGCATTNVNPLTCKTPYTSEQLRQIMQYHIQTVMKYYKARYPGMFITWDVANEIAYGDDYPSRHSVFEKIVDPATNQNSYTYYLKLAFQYAQQADSDAHLCLNENTFEDIDSARAKRVYQFVKTLKNSGAPISCMGYEMHKSLVTDTSAFAFSSENALLESMQRFGSIGINVFLTEMDVGVPTVSQMPLTGAAIPSTSTQATSYWTAQADVYGAALRACLASMNCEGAIFWDLNPMYNWEGTSGGLNLYGMPAGFGGDATIFNANNSPKPAFTSVQTALQNALTSADVVGGGGSSGGLSFTSSAPLYDIHLLATAVNTPSGWPTFSLTVDGAQFTTVKITSRNQNDYVVQVPLTNGHHGVVFAPTAASTALGQTATVNKIWVQPSAVSFQTILGNEFAPPTSGTFTIDALNQATSQITLKSDGEAHQTLNVPVTGQYELTLSAFGTLANNVGPNAILLVDGATAATFAVSATGTPHDYLVNVNLTRGSHTFAVEFNNALTLSSTNYRSLIIDHLSVQSMVQHSVDVNSPAMSFSCSGCSNGPRLMNDGNASATVYVPDGTYVLDVREASHQAKDTSGKSAFAQGTVKVDGLAVGNITANNDAWIDATYTLQMKAGNHHIEVDFVNGAAGTGFFGARNLMLDGFSLQPK